MVENSKREAIEKLWEESYWIGEYSSESVRELKAYFLEESSTIPYVHKIYAYAYREIISGMIEISPKKVLELLFEQKNFKLRKEIFSQIIPYLIENAFEVYESYPEQFFEALRNVGRTGKFLILKKFYLKNPKEYEGKLVEDSTLFLNNLKSEGDGFIDGEDEKISLGQAYYQLFKKQMSGEAFKKYQLDFLTKYLLNKKNNFYFDDEAIDIYFLKELDSILEDDAFFNFIKEYISLKPLSKDMSAYFYERFEDKSIEIFETFVKASNPNLTAKEQKNFYKILEKLDIGNAFEAFLAFTFSEFSIGNINIATPLMLKYEEKLLSLLKTKKGEDKLLLQLILLSSSTESTKEMLVIEFQKESNDKKIREILLPSIARRVYGDNMTLSEVNEIIALAKKRKKLDKWKEPFEEEAVPKLYFKDGKPLNSDQVRFLFYRMSMVTQMESDIEANLLINHIDKSKSNEFAKFVLEGFLANGSKAPQKYLMALAGIFGDDDLLDYLKKIFNEVFEAKRMKMAQYVIGTLALIGTDKALRFIEFVGRKHKKKAALHDYCLSSLEIAAKELGITSDELSEKIIPDFGFDGLYKTIDVEGEEFRVFVAKDFKLQYINEDNKIRKSLPKGVSKELKAELKTIQAEIRDVNKAGSGRLEQYMVKERRWNFEAWEKFYLNNPVMFIYASTLVWGIYDENNVLKELFYVDEDSSMMNIEDDEVEIEEGDKIGMVHPLRLTDEQKKSWKAHFYELEIAQPFKQLDREVFRLTKEEENQKSLSRFTNKTPEKGSGAIKTLLDKRGYRKDVVDGGCIDFYKDFNSLNIRVNLGIYGINVVYDYDDFSEIDDTTFTPIDGKWDEKILLKDIPEMVMSEVILDMEMVMGK